MENEQDGSERGVAIVTPGDLSATVSLPITVEQAKAQWQEYQRLCQELLDESDYQNIGGNKFRKKSGWRKLGRAFNLDTRVLTREVERDDRGRPIWAGFLVEASAPTRSGARVMTGYHEAHLQEKCCPVAFGEGCTKTGRHNHCSPNCSGRPHWSQPGDIAATAETRATNRAISNLIGAGEVSAEEAAVNGAGPSQPDGRASTTRKATGQAARASAAAQRYSVEDLSRAGIKPSQVDGFVEDGVYSATAFWRAVGAAGLTVDQVYDYFGLAKGDTVPLWEFLKRDEKRTLQGLIESVAAGPPVEGQVLSAGEAEAEAEPEVSDSGAPYGA
jgi:hypothetical protein